VADIGYAAQEIGEFRRRERRHSVGNGRIIAGMSATSRTLVPDFTWVRANRSDTPSRSKGIEHVLALKSRPTAPIVRYQIDKTKTSNPHVLRRL
jgi:hypothetical protein